MYLDQISEQSKKLLSMLALERVIVIEKDETAGTLSLTEGCDEYYSVQLSKDLCAQLAVLFTELQGLLE